MTAGGTIRTSQTSTLISKLWQNAPFTKASMKNINSQSNVLGDSGHFPVRPHWFDTFGHNRTHYFSSCPVVPLQAQLGTVFSFRIEGFTLTRSGHTLRTPFNHLFVSRGDFNTGVTLRSTTISHLLLCKPRNRAAPAKPARSSRMRPPQKLFTHKIG
jgi:hypothetical protein